MGECVVKFLVFTTLAYTLTIVILWLNGGRQ